ncbi:Cytochrome P450 2J2 [Hypsibius exemplaris]|uniref:Cytochrome P450 2J2 n=1 Tax=Hypsibius exemplaris TaxID=2072580 RepID=A0A1W0WKX1_HYPEX|nr:Cytochrome P450 2J2 [Hypsibius exemplaris]
MDLLAFLASFPVFNELSVTVLAVSLYWYKHRNIPPGPSGLPFLGYAPFFGTNPQDYFLELGKNDDDGKVHGITLTEGDIWKTTRRFMLQTFRDLGMGKLKLQDRILDEAEYMTNIFAKHAGRPFNPLPTLMCSVSNVLCSLCFGKRFEHDDPAFQHMLKNLSEFTMLLSQAGPVQSYPMLRFLPGSIKTAWESVVRIKRENHLAMSANVEEHRSTYDANETRDYIDAFLHQQKKEAESAGGTQPAFYDAELMKNLSAFFGAGTETTAMTMYWSLLFMLHNPEVQKKIHQKLDEQVGEGKSVTLEDRANTEETTLMGYRIPKRCFIMPNFKSVNVDPKLWTDPLTFNPNRFLDEQGKVFEPAHFMPFSIGKRACVGEALARMEIFLFFANTMQRFLIRAPRDSDIPSTDEYTTGISCRPTEFKIEAVPR